MPPWATAISSRSRAASPGTLLISRSAASLSAAPLPQREREDAAEQRDAERHPCDVVADVTAVHGLERPREPRERDECQAWQAPTIEAEHRPGEAARDRDNGPNEARRGRRPVFSRQVGH